MTDKHADETRHLSGPCRQIDPAELGARKFPVRPRGHRTRLYQERIAACLVVGEAPPPDDDLPPDDLRKFAAHKRAEAREAQARRGRS